jgi:hypothetical protein
MIRVLHNIHPIDTDVGEFGVTVRRGLKWADAKIDEQLDLCVCPQGPDGPHEVVGRGTVVGVWGGAFHQIPGRMIENEHEESSRMYSGLLASMRRAYGAGVRRERGCRRPGLPPGVLTRLFASSPTCCT